MEALIVVGSTVITFGILKCTAPALKQLFLRQQRIKEKNRLKNNLNKSLKEKNYNIFRDAIYEIKNYDTTYNKRLYIKMKELHTFTDKEVENHMYFFRRFGSNTCDDKDTKDDLKRILQQISILKEEVEQSLNKCQNDYLNNL